MSDVEHQAGETTEPGAPDVTSALADLRARRRRPLEQLYTDLPIPRYDPPVFVRYKPISQDRLEEINKKAEKSKEKRATSIANATLLADACLGLFEVNDAGEAVSIDPRNPTVDQDKWLRFDDGLLELFDDIERSPRSAEYVLQMYFTDGDVARAVADVARFSGYTDGDIEQEFAGN